MFLKGLPNNIISDYHSGDLSNSYKFFGSHLCHHGGKSCPQQGVFFRTWAPFAYKVSVVGSFNNWNPDKNILFKTAEGYWEGIVPEAMEGDQYKYCILGADNIVRYKSDPYAFTSQIRPDSASIVFDIDREYPWTDYKWMDKRRDIDWIHSPVNIYELHLGSWRRGNIPGIDYENDYSQADKRKSEEPMLNYREIALELAEYCKDMNYTHVEIMPISEHPFDGSWGYQTTGYYSITSRYGTPDDFRYFVDYLHSFGIAVILDWVPVHYCKDEFGLYKFDGSFLYEYDTEILRENKLWGTVNFDLTKGEVQSFLISNAAYFFREYHIDGIRADAVVNLLYHSYGQPENMSARNVYGGRENLEGIAFLRKLNLTMYEEFHNPMMIAEDSSSWPMVTKPTYIGGLGFTFKWCMGWMHDTLEYLQTDPLYRKYIHNKMNFSVMYVFNENYILPLSHDEVVHGKKTILDKMHGILDAKFDTVRAYYTYMIAHPGKKLLFMGNEFGQIMEWRYYEELEWKMLAYTKHSGLKEFISQLNYLYRTQKALWDNDDSYDSFEWIDADNKDESVFSFIRKSKNPNDFLVVVCNFTPVRREKFEVGVSRFADYYCIMNSNSSRFGGTDEPEDIIIRPVPSGRHNKPFHLKIDLPGNSAVIYKPIFRK